MRRNKRTGTALGTILLACGFMALAAGAPEGGNTIVLKSPVMKAGEVLPVDQTQHGWDYSPPLTWTNLPKGTVELALILDGPVDTHPRPFIHWVVYNIPASAKGLPQALPMEDHIDAPKELAGTVQGHTGWGSPGYRGPWPTRGPEERYRFRLYALDAKLNFAPGLDKNGLLDSIAGHVIGTGELIMIVKAYGFS